MDRGGPSSRTVALAGAQWGLKLRRAAEWCQVGNSSHISAFAYKQYLRTTIFTAERIVTILFHQDIFRSYIVHSNHRPSGVCLVRWDTMNVQRTGF